MLTELAFELVKMLMAVLVESFHIDEKIPRLYAKLHRAERSLWNEVARKNMEKMMAGDIAIHGPYRNLPGIRIQAAAAVAPALAIEAENWRQKLRCENRPNDPHGIVLGEVSWDDDPLSFRIEVVDYGQLCAMRSVAGSGQPPRVLSANALVVCPQERLLMLHRRAPDSATYPSHLHTVGGGYWPPGLEGREGDGHSLRDTAIREIHEETRASISIEPDTPMIVMEETRTGFVQAAFLGCAISRSDRAYIRESSEGSIVWVGFDELEAKLDGESKWVPTGKAALLAWLAMGAPGAGNRPRFGKYSATQLFQKSANVSRAGGD